MKGQIAASAALTAILWSAINGAGATQQEVDLSQFRNCASATCSTDLIRRFHLDQPRWSSPVVYDETGLPLAPRADEHLPTFKIWRAPGRIISVRDLTTGTMFSADKDYVASTRSLSIPAGSRIKVQPADFPYTPLPNTPEAFIPWTKAGTPMRVSLDFGVRQVAVTYEAGPAVERPAVYGKIPRVSARLSNGQRVAVTFYGDSITAGEDTSGWLKVPPHQPNWVDLTGALLSRNAPGRFYWRNKGIGGWSAAGGLRDVDQRVTTTASDLVTLGFGLNDSVGGVPGDIYEANLRGIIGAIRAKHATTEFLLISSWPGNNEWKPVNNDLLRQYRDAMKRIAADTAGVAVVDLTTISQKIIDAKSYFDVSTSGINHPNDFMHVIYAQAITMAISNR